MVQFPLLESIKLILTLFMIIGIIGIIYHDLKNKNYQKFLFSLLIPFYPIYRILQLPETREKKFLSILTMGSFILFVFVSILILILTPPQ